MTHYEKQTLILKTYGKFCAYILVFCAGFLAANSFYFDADGFGVITNYGGYHVSLLGD